MAIIMKGHTWLNMQSWIQKTCSGGGGGGLLENENQKHHYLHDMEL